MTSFSLRERIPTSPPCLLCDQEYAQLTVERVLMIMILSPDPNTLVEHRTYPHAHELDCWYQEDCNFLVLLQHYEHGSLFSCDQRVMENHVHHML